MTKAELIDKLKKLREVEFCSARYFKEHFTNEQSSLQCLAKHSAKAEGYSTAIKFAEQLDDPADTKKCIDCGADLRGAIFVRDTEPNNICTKCWEKRQKSKEPCELCGKHILTAVHAKEKNGGIIPRTFDESWIHFCPACGRRLGGGK